MSAPQGGSTPNAFVFPPFVPPAPRAAPPQPAPAVEVAMEVPLPAHDLGDPETELPRAAEPEEEPRAWEATAAPAEADDDLPWLEMPAGGSRVHVAETPAPAADEEMAGWAGWGLNDAPAAGFAPDTPVADLSPAAPVEEYSAPATQSWEEMFAPADDFAAPAASPAEDALSAEVEPAAEIPAEMAAPVAESEAALELEAAGLATEVVPAEPVAYPSPVAAELEARDAAPPVAEVHPVAGGLDEVAERLEGIARALRNDPDSFLAGHTSDPLGLLVTGFVLGYRQSR